MKRKTIYFLIFAWIILASGCREKFDPLQSPDENTASPVDNPETGTITVVSPRAGDSYQTGEDLLVQWQITGNVKSLKIQLYRDGQLIVPISVSATADATVSWFIPGAMISSNNYRIKVTSGINSNIFSYSDPFTILQQN